MCVEPILPSDDHLIQSEPLLLQVMDKDYVSSDDSIGLVAVDLNMLLGYTQDKTKREVRSWFPIYDSLNGICGHIELTVQLSYVGNFNATRGSSAGVSFFKTDTPPLNLRIKRAFSRVEAIVVTADPEFSWTDTFRSARTSNQARSNRVMRKIGEARRLLGAKAREQGGNAVLHYEISVDVEGEPSDEMCVRACGTAVHLVPWSTDHDERLDILAGVDTIDTANTSPVTTIRATDSLAVIRKLAAKRFVSDQIVFLTLSDLPPHTIGHIGGMVTARAVHVLKDITEDDHSNVRSQWWSAIRKEMSSTARKLNCNCVVGYTEKIAIHGGVAVISGQGTAARIHVRRITKMVMPAPPRDTLVSGQPIATHHAGTDSHTMTVRRVMRRKPRGKLPGLCNAVHPPYRHNDMSVGTSVCCYCGVRRAPLLLLASMSPPPELPVHGDPVLLQARVRLPVGSGKIHGEGGAVRVSDKLPFVENDLHAQLIRQMYAVGVNAAFSLSTELHLDNEFVTAVCTGTGLYVTAMSPPPQLTVERPIDQASLVAFNAITERLSSIHRQSSTLEPHTAIPRTASSSSLEETTSSSSSSTDSTEPDLDATLHDNIDPQLQRLVVGGSVSTDHAEAVMCRPRCNAVVSTLASTSASLGPPSLLTAVTLIQEDENIHHEMQALFDGLAAAHGSGPGVISIARVHLTQCDDSTAVLLVVASHQVPRTDGGSVDLGPTPTLTPTPTLAPLPPATIGDDKGRGRSGPALPQFTTAVLSPFTSAGSLVPRANKGVVEVVIVRESMAIKKAGGFDGFWHGLVLEGLSMLRSRVLALGGNAALSVDIKPLHINYRPSYDQCYTMVRVSGDVAVCAPGPHRIASTMDMARPDGSGR